MTSNVQLKTKIEAKWFILTCRGRYGLEAIYNSGRSCTAFIQNLADNLSELSGSNLFVFNFGIDRLCIAGHGNFQRFPEIYCSDCRLF